MTLRSVLTRLAAQEDLNFLLTNRIPRQAMTRFMGWFSKIEQPLVRDLSLAAWRLFADLELEDTEQRDFKSMHECFIRRLRPGTRPIDPDPDVLVSPCDGIVGAAGNIAGTRLFQAKGFPYSLQDLLNDPALVDAFRDGTYVTIRISSSMYHRFHAPADCSIDRVDYLSGDTWNVNPIALKRVERLFCRNERAVIRARVEEGGDLIAMVPVAAVLVASIRLNFLDVLLHLKYRGPNVMPCTAHVSKGEELGWFQHGSTIIVFAPPGFSLCPAVVDGHVIRMGQALLRRS